MLPAAHKEKLGEDFPKQNKHPQIRVKLQGAEAGKKAFISKRGFVQNVHFVR